MAIALCCVSNNISPDPSKVTATLRFIANYLCVGYTSIWWVVYGDTSIWWVYYCAEMGTQWI